MKTEKIIEELKKLLNKSDAKENIELNIVLQLDKEKDVKIEEIEEIEFDEYSEYEHIIHRKISMDDIKFSLALSPILEEFPKLKIKKGSDITAYFLEPINKTKTGKEEFRLIVNKGEATIIKINGLNEEKIASFQTKMKNCEISFNSKYFTGGLKDINYLIMDGEMYGLKPKSFSIKDIKKYEKDDDFAFLIAASSLIKDGALIVEYKNKKIFSDNAIFNLGILKQLSSDAFYYNLLKEILINMLIFTPRTGDLLEFFNTLNECQDLKNYPVKIDKNLQKIMSKKNYEKYPDGVYSLMSSVIYECLNNGIEYIILNKTKTQAMIKKTIEEGEFILKIEQIYDKIIITTIMVFESGEVEKIIKKYLNKINNYINDVKREFMVAGISTYSIVKKGNKVKLVSFESKHLV